MSGEADTVLNDDARDKPKKPAQPKPQAESEQKPGAAAISVPIILLLLAIGIVAVFFWNWDDWVGDRINQRTNDAYLQSNVTPISAKISGYVRLVAVQDYARVKLGQLLYKIVDDDYRAQEAQAEANLASAQAAIENTRAQRDLQVSVIRQAQAAMARDKLQLSNDQTDLRRYRNLAPNGAITKQTADTQSSKVAEDEAGIQDDLAKIEAQEKELNVYGTQIVQEQAETRAREAALSLARITLGYTRIVAPADGVLGQRQAQAGQYVNVGSQVITLAPLPDVWVIANYKETQLTRVRIGQSAFIRVDSFPGTVLHGRVDTISPASGAQFSLLPPDNATGNFTKVVQRISVKITLDPPDPLVDLLRPGMSVEATIHTDDPAPAAAPAS